FFFFQAEDGIRDLTVTGVQTCALPILAPPGQGPRRPPAAGTAPSPPSREPPGPARGPPGPRAAPPGAALRPGSRGPSIHHPGIQVVLELDQVVGRVLEDEGGVLLDLPL